MLQCGLFVVGLWLIYIYRCADGFLRSGFLKRDLHLSAKKLVCTKAVYY